MDNRIRLLIVDDHPILRKGLYFVLDSKFGIEVVGEAINGFEAIEKAIDLKPDVILMDLMMPKMDGLNAIQAIKQLIPSQKILVLTGFMVSSKLVSAINSGALGFVLKDSPPEELIHAIMEVAKGNLYLQPYVAAEFVAELQSPPVKPLITTDLTAKESEILQSLGMGLSNKNIANLMNIAPGTVRTHVSSILRKLNLESRTQAALYARKQAPRNT
jgi:two-component system, NarL family, response regulator LiaR